MARDKTQELFRFHIWNEYGLQNVFFRTLDNVHYADVAICGKCGSNRVMFDIDFDDGLFENLSKRLGIPKDVVMSDLHKIVEKVEKSGL